QGQWVRGKSLDTYCPFGPAIVTADQVPDVQSLDVRTTLNGQTVQEMSTEKMIFNVRRLIEFISSGITLEPGDLICSGTPPGVGHHQKPPLYLKPGDVVQVEIEGLGRIRNEVQD
ncbi:MAG: fumarylacetoacetate hydrolase family protein, partial [Rudaea sp.]